MEDKKASALSYAEKFWDELLYSFNQQDKLIQKKKTQTTQKPTGKYVSSLHHLSNLNNSNYFYVSP